MLAAESQEHANQDGDDGRVEQARHGDELERNLVVGVEHLDAEAQVDDEGGDQLGGDMAQARTTWMSAVARLNQGGAGVPSGSSPAGADGVGAPRGAMAGLSSTA